MDQEIRSKGIGGSEIASVLGLNKWQSPYQLWLVKTGQGPGPVMNKFMEAGTILEDAIAKFFERRTGHVIVDPHDRTNIHPKYPFVIGTPDRYFEAENKPDRGVLECKSTQSNIDDVPPSWFCQLQWYLGITGSLHGAVAWLTRGVDFGYREYEYDAKFFDYMVDKADTFWHHNVLKGIAPDPIVVEDYEKIYNKHIEGKTITTDDLTTKAHQRLLEIKEELKTLEEEQSNCVAAIKMHMEDAEALVDGDQILVTWKAGKPAMMFNAKRFEVEHPRLYKKFLIEKANSRRFLVKG